MYYIHMKRKHDRPVDDDIKRLVLFTREEQQKALFEAHDLNGGHQGQKRTLARIVKDYFWTTMAKDVASWIYTCKNCQKMEKVMTVAKVLHPINVFNSAEPNVPADESLNLGASGESCFPYGGENDNVAQNVVGRLAMTPRPSEKPALALTPFFKSKSPNKSNRPEKPFRGFAEDTPRNQEVEQKMLPPREPKDPEELFFESCVLRMKRLSPQTKSYLQLQISTLFCNAENQDKTPIPIPPLPVRPRPPKSQCVAGTEATLQDVSLATSDAAADVTERPSTVQDSVNDGAC